MEDPRSTTKMYIDRCSICSNLFEAPEEDNDTPPSCPECSVGNSSPPVRQTEVIYKFHLPDNREEFIRFQYSWEMYSALYEIKQLCRSATKYQEKDTIKVDKVMELITDIPLDEMSS